MKRNPRISKTHRARANTVDYDELRRDTLSRYNNTDTDVKCDNGAWMVRAATARKPNKTNKRHGSSKRHWKDDTRLPSISRAHNSRKQKNLRTAFIDEKVKPGSRKPGSRKHSKENLTYRHSTVHVDELLVDDQGRLYLVDDAPQKRSRQVSDNRQLSKKESFRKHEHEFSRNRHFPSRRNKSYSDVLVKCEKDGNKFQVYPPHVTSPERLDKKLILVNREHQDHAFSDDESVRGVSGNENVRKRVGRRKVKKGVKRNKIRENNTTQESIQHKKSWVRRERRRKKFPQKQMSTTISEDYAHSDDESARRPVVKKVNSDEKVIRKRRKRARKHRSRSNTRKGKYERRTRSVGREKVKNRTVQPKSEKQAVVIRSWAPPKHALLSRGLSNESSDCPVNPNPQLFVESLGLDSPMHIHTQSLNILPQEGARGEVHKIPIVNDISEVTDEPRKFYSSSKILMAMQSERNFSKSKRFSGKKEKHSPSDVRGAERERRKGSPMRYNKKKKTSKRRGRNKIKQKSKDHYIQAEKQHAYSKAKTMSFRNETMSHGSGSPRQHRLKSSLTKKQYLDKIPKIHRHSFERTVPSRMYSNKKLGIDHVEEKELKGTVEEEKPVACQELAQRSNKWMMLHSNDSSESPYGRGGSSLEKESESEFETVSPLSGNIAFEYSGHDSSKSYNSDSNTDALDAKAIKEQRDINDEDCDHIFVNKINHRINSKKEENFNIQSTNIQKSNSQDLADLTSPSHTQEAGCFESYLDGCHPDSEQFPRHNTKNKIVKQFPKQEVIQEPSNQLLLSIWSDACKKERSSTSYSDEARFQGNMARKMELGHEK